MSYNAKYKIFLPLCTNKILKPNIFSIIHSMRLHNRSDVIHVDRNCKQTESAQFKFQTADIIQKWNSIFEENGIDEPKLSIENIIAHVFQTRKISDIYKHENKFLTKKQIKEIVNLSKLRLDRMPIQYIIGEWDFRDLTLKMKPPVFIPRPETERLVELLLSEIDPSTTEILELCCGSGAISLALLKDRINLQVTAIDKSKEACDLTTHNACLYGLSDRLNILQTSIENIDTGLFNRKLDVIVSNPPYVPSKDLECLQPEILKYEDRDALDGGSDGLVLIKLILQKSSYLLCGGGKTFLEVDPSHPQLLENFLRENNHLRLSIQGIHKDIFGRDRFIIIKKI